MYALVDCNNFFVSCERAFQPELEGKPVVVLSNNDGCVVARSNESKAMGIKMGTPFFQVRNLSDSGKLIVKSSNYVLYGDLSRRVMSILRETTLVIRPPNAVQQALSRIMPSPIKVISEKKSAPGWMLMEMMPAMPRMIPSAFLQFIRSSGKIRVESRIRMKPPMESRMVDLALLL